MPQVLDDSFLQLVEPHRRELRLHCYRMLGSSHDSDDMMQETLVRAWRALGLLEEPSMVRPWLYRIATNVCLDELKQRKDRRLPSDVVPQGDPAAEPVPPSLETTWLEPCPDGWIVGTSVDPGSAYELKEGVALAFVAALQCLSARQRAVLLLRDVVGMPASETASALGMTVAAADSTLHRARTAARERTGGRAEETLARVPSEINGELLGRYIGAWQARDVDAFVALLHEEVLLNMPPSPTWLRGKVAVGTFYATHAFVERRALGFLPIGANGQPGFGCYVGGQLTAIHVLRIHHGRVVEMHHFMSPECLGLFGLPDTLATT
jgi:RNA polymerase sigma-70 factor (ECF subfamily)